MGDVAWAALITGLFSLAGLVTAAWLKSREAVRRIDATDERVEWLEKAWARCERRAARLERQVEKLEKRG